MPKILLSQGFVVSPPACPTGKSKIDYFDSQLPGFLLEVRPSGKCTYYQRYRDRYGRMKQVRLGPTDALSLDEARQRARLKQLGTGFLYIFMWISTRSGPEL